MARSWIIGIEGFGWRFDWDGIRAWENIFIWVHWNSTEWRGVHGENDCWLHVLSIFYFISPSWKNLLRTRGLSVARKLLAVLVRGWWSSSRVEQSKPLSCCLIWLGGVDSLSVFLLCLIQVSSYDTLLVHGSVNLHFIKIIIRYCLVINGVFKM